MDSYICEILPPRAEEQSENDEITNGAFDLHRRNDRRRRLTSSSRRTGSKGLGILNIHLIWHRETATSSDISESTSKINRLMRWNHFSGAIETVFQPIEKGSW